MSDEIRPMYRERVADHFAGRRLAWRIFEACLDAMHVEPHVVWKDGVMTLELWYPCIEVYPEDWGLRLHVDLYYHRKQRRLHRLDRSGWHELRLRRVAQVDDQVRAWIREALEVGNFK